MDFERLYFVEDRFTPGALRVEAQREIVDPARLFWGEERPASPVRFTHAMGGKPRDLIWTTHGFPFLVSDRTIAVLHDNHFTGWTTYPVEVSGKGGERIEGYHGFAVTGRVGEVDLTRRVRIRKPLQERPFGGFAVWRGVYFTPSTWDGSDVFVMAGGVLAIITEPVKRVLERAKISNVSFVRLTEFEEPIVPEGPPGVQLQQ
jgi:hypothetical protein